MAARDARTGELLRLTSLRAFAALMVFGYHLGVHTTWGPGGSTFRHGYVGVAFFFVLSGFVLAWSTPPDLPARQFWGNRFARVYPSHAVMAVVALLVPVTAYAVTPAAVAANLTLVQAWVPSWPITFGLNAPSWSLSCEAFFYLLAPWVIGWAHRQPTRRVAVRLGAWWLASALAGLAMGWWSNATDVYAFTNPAIRSGEFALGILGAFAIRRGLAPRLPISAAVIACLAVWWLTHDRLMPQSVTGVAFTLPFLALVMAAGQADLAQRPGLLTLGPLVYAGRLSFAFYLVHELVLLNAPEWYGASPTALPDRVGLALTLFLVATAAAMALHHLVELPAQLRLRKLLGSGRGRSAATRNGPQA